MNISVIIPTLNRRDYVLDMLKDLSIQTLSVNEVIVSDQSVIFEKIENSYPYKFTHFQHKGKGPCCSRNDAVSFAKGEILIFLDDDARIDSNFVYEITKSIVEKKSKVCSGSICNIDGTVVNKEQLNSYWFFKLTLAPKKEIDSCYYTPAGCTAITKDLFCSIGKYDLFFDPNGAGEDRELAVRLVNSGHKIYFNPKAKLLHIGALSGGRRNINNVSLEFIKNVGYIIYKYYGNKKLIGFKLYLINQRIKKIIKLEMPFYNFQMIFKILKITKTRLYI
ncbi:glycosyltransferase family 2 protein [Flavobacterium lacus]|uniref:GT2 family glycosyltransferase n=1 Tax=Flavobacterium lacus TaxID=1353778 RepID=A0A328WRX3_9FLAO|nr:glycosyltransferase family A protein [Flavobacterium lacus]RAR46604.1 GT2 family glycosyltransferase [Flavobacterium lacus]